MTASLAAPWHTLDAEAVATALDVDPHVGLTGDDAARRRADHGPNLIADAKTVPAWRKVLTLLADKMTLVLVVAAIVSATVSREWETPVVIFAVIVLNTVLGYVQEARAENSLQALKQMSVSTTTVRRDGGGAELPRADVVPGDIVLLEAGDTVPADGRIVTAVRLQVAEAALTGESQPVDKTVDTVTDEQAPLGDRGDMLFMNTEITRGRAEMIVTDTGMATEMGAIAALLGTAGVEQTPLQRRIGQLAQTLTIVAIVTVAAVFVLGLLRGQSWSDLLVTAVSLAVATIPEGLTAVVAFTLAMGASRLAARGAIVKRLAAVETLGSTTHIATDKTGTLTLNEMTVQRLLVAGRAFRVTGTGYGTDGKILVGDGLPAPDLTDALLGMALCNDATVHDGTLVGDPTEGALVVLAEKGGVDVEGARTTLGRIAEVPFDSAYKYMATFHSAPDGSYRCYAKGAPGILLGRATSVLGADGEIPLDDALSTRILRAVDTLAADGLRTLMIAGRRLDAVPRGDADALQDRVSELTVYAVVGIVDPPRPEARDAIATAHEAGIAVHMITGDHLVTASAIAADLGINGHAASGTELDGFTDDELRDRASGFGVLARVSPEHKIRFVEALQADGQIVAMTGDGVNDAPALEQSDIGVAMGITGTDVSKGAADMILTDDNFATIVAAVAEGRGIYDNIIKFVKFQLTTAWGFVLIFLAAGALGLAGGAPFTALQILWVNIIMDGPPALALGVDPAEPGTMKRPPRPARETLLNRARLQRILGLGVIMAVGTLAMLHFAPDLFPDSAGDPRFATTLAFTTFVFFQVFNLFNVRSDLGSVFSAQTLTNHTVWIALAAVIVMQICVVQFAALQEFFDTTALTSQQWLCAVAVGSTVLWVDEIGKVVARRVEARRLARTEAPVLT
ncbi:MAG: cation-translocating P-type ATPase [Rhodococcus sp.]|uniref:cation-translocating P-type ATPase n=1 Tax=Rhodococcus TaxID=1827 RepID=UPI0016B9179F|nr:MULTISPECIES: cation-translocating P-type ATPase [Rhodococcus]NLV80147.1 cation-translocating P-type ATPase [Rhodococcus sp. (in: high G+C Gram-positive bacteria)]